MTPAQLQTLKAHILASTDPDVQAALAIRNDTEMARLYNLPSTFIVWRRNIQLMEFGKAVLYNAVAGLTTANSQRVQVFAALNTTTFNGSSDLDVFFSDTFGGALNGSGQACRDALAAMLRRAATVCEQIFVTGTGTTVSPGNLVFEGQVSPSDIGAALNG